MKMDSPYYYGVCSKCGKATILKEGYCGACIKDAPKVELPECFKEVFGFLDKKGDK